MEVIASNQPPKKPATGATQPSHQPLADGHRLAICSFEHCARPALTECPVCWRLVCRGHLLACSQCPRHFCVNCFCDFVACCRGSVGYFQKAMPAATPSLDAADSPRPLRDPSAPRIEGSSIHGFYGQDAGKSFQTDTARADPGSPHAEELQSRFVNPCIELSKARRYLEKGPFAGASTPCALQTHHPQSQK